MKFEPHLLDEIRQRLPISQVVGESVIWDKRKSQPHRGDYWACCPFHGEKSPSFHVDDRKGFGHCFGCNWSGDIFKFLTEHTGCSFPEAVEQLAGMAGVSLPERDTRPLSDAEKADRDRRQAEARAKHEEDRRAALAQQEAEREERILDAKSVWKESIVLAGSLGDTYLQSRGLPPVSEWPWDCRTVLRFHPALDYELDRKAGKWPAIVCRNQSAEEAATGIWQIYVARDGKRKVPLENAKVGRGPAGGGAVRIGGEGPSIGIAEGVETALAAWFLNGCRKPVWAGLSTSGVAGFEPPLFVERIEVFPDGDRAKAKLRRDEKFEVGERPGMLAARNLAARMIPVLGKENFSIAPEPVAGSDYLDVYVSMKQRGLI